MNPNQPVYSVLECPFCGMSPLIVEEKEYGVAISCSCPPEPIVMADDLEDAVRLWNTRGGYELKPSGIVTVSGNATSGWDMDNGAANEEEPEPEPVDEEQASVDAFTAELYNEIFARWVENMKKWERLSMKKFDGA